MQESGLTVRSQMVKGFVDLAVMTVLDRGESYGYEVVSWLEKSGLGAVSHASLYASLKRLEESGMLTVTVRPSGIGPNRRYYRLTSRGRRQREQLSQTWHELGAALTILEMP